MKNPFRQILYNKATAAVVKKYYDRKLHDLESYIFVATTGRSGTLTLVDIFQRIDGCVALHEPYPAMHASILEAAARGDFAQVENFYKIRKSVNIRRAAMRAKHYIEANHLFIKTFAQFAAEDFDEKLKVIHLVRNPAHVANSIYALQDQPGTEEGNRWWLDYRAPTNLISIADILDKDREFSHPYYKALWYWFETESRILMWKQKLPNVPFIFFQTENFNNPKALAVLLNELKIVTPFGFENEVGSMRSHARTSQKVVPPLPDELTKEMLQKFIILLKENENNIPATLDLYF